MPPRKTQPPRPSKAGRRGGGPAGKSAGRTGLPAPESVIGEAILTSPAGRVYRILKTGERDEYDQPPAPGEGAAGTDK